MTIFGYTLPQIRKSIITGLGFAIAVLTLFIQGGFGPQQWVGYAVIALGLATTALAFAVKNAPSDPVPFPVIVVPPPAAVVLPPAIVDPLPVAVDPLVPPVA